MRHKATLIVIVAVLAAFFAAYLGYSQSQAAIAVAEGKLTEELTKALGSDVTIEKIEIAAVNKIILHSVTVKDSYGKPIAVDEQVTVIFNPLALLKGKRP